MVHLHNGIQHSRKKEGTPSLCDNMDGTGDYDAIIEVSQVVKGNYYLILHIRGT